MGRWQNFRADEGRRDAPYEPESTERGHSRPAPREANAEELVDELAEAAKVAGDGGTQ